MIEAVIRWKIGIILSFKPKKKSKKKKKFFFLAFCTRKRQFFLSPVFSFRQVPRLRFNLTVWFGDFSSCDPDEDSCSRELLFFFCFFFKFVLTRHKKKVELRITEQTFYWEINHCQGDQNARPFRKERQKKPSNKTKPKKIFF